MTKKRVLLFSLLAVSETLVRGEFCPSEVLTGLKRWEIRQKTTDQEQLEKAKAKRERKRNRNINLNMTKGTNNGN